MQRSVKLLFFVMNFSYMNVNQLGMLGTSVLYSSGDNGVAGSSGLCLNASGSSIFISTLLFLTGCIRSSH